jgi:hypothetical protein
VTKINAAGPEGEYIKPVVALPFAQLHFLPGGAQNSSVQVLIESAMGQGLKQEGPTGS